MKLRNLSLIIIFGLIILSANAGLCTEQIAQHLPDSADTIPVKETAAALTVTKFVITMAGVVLSSVAIWTGLTIYNKFFVKDGGRISGNNDILNTPKTIADAVTFFIKKNKLN